MNLRISFNGMFLSAVLMACVPAWATPNLVTNGTFATGDFSDWTVTNAGPTNSAAVVIRTDDVARNFPAGAFGQAIPDDPLTIPGAGPNTGYGAYFSTDSGTETLSQVIALRAGVYSIGFDLLVPRNGYLNPGDATFTANIAGTGLLTSASIKAIGGADGTQTWVEVAGTAAIASTGDYDVNFAFTGLGNGRTAADVVVDDVFVVGGAIVTGHQDIPEPASMTLFMVPLLGLMMTRLTKTGLGRA